MARRAKIYYQDEFAGYLAEADGGFTFYYDEEYLKSSDSKSNNMIMPLCYEMENKPVQIKLNLKYE